MSSFEFPNFTPARLNSVNVRSEKHGPELVPAVDLKLSIDSSNAILHKFHPDLLASLYFKAQENDEQNELDGIEPVTNLPNLKFPRMGDPIKWDLVGAGYTLAIDFGLGGDSNLMMYGCQINNFGISPKEGGTVEIVFRVQISEIDEHIIGKLATLCQHEVSVMLIAPTVAEVSSHIESMESPFSNQAALDAMDDDTPKTESDLFRTPEQAFAESLEAETPVH